MNLKVINLNIFYIQDTLHTFHGNYKGKIYCNYTKERINSYHIKKDLKIHRNCCSHEFWETNSLRRTTQIVECNLLRWPAQGRVSS